MPRNDRDHWRLKVLRLLPREKLETYADFEKRPHMMERKTLEAHVLNQVGEFDMREILLWIGMMTGAAK